MNLRNQMILGEYKEKRETYVELDKIVDGLLEQLINNKDNHIMTIQHRVKAVDSLAGKLDRDNDRFSKLSDLTDIFGARIISYFADDIDTIGSEVQKLFTIDEQNSSDRRQTIKADTFGYVSLHYICSLPKNQGYSDELCNIRFEIQIRTILQHAWAEIEHDLGYKTSFGIPRSLRREFSRVAGLLEIADDEFTRIRQGVSDYTESIRKQIVENKAEDVQLDAVSLKEFMNLNTNMKEFTLQIAAINNSEIEEALPDNYLEPLHWLKKESLGDLQNMIDSNIELAWKLAENALAGTELDIISSSVGLLYICRAELLNRGMTREEIVEFLNLTIKDMARAEAQADRLIDKYKKIK